MLAVCLADAYEVIVGLESCKRSFPSFDVVPITICLCLCYWLTIMIEFCYKELVDSQIA